MELEELLKKYNISDDKIKNNMLRSGENAYRTSAKELIGYKIISRNKLLKKCAEMLGCEYLGYKKITNKKEQKRGVDLVLHSNIGDFNIDLKSEILGDYTLEAQDVLVAEIYQNNLFTNHKGKSTDYVLYVISDIHGERAWLVDYDKLSNFCLNNKRKYEDVNVDGTVYKKEVVNSRYYTSNNKSGVYIKAFPDELGARRVL
jgi:hypothetical protein